MGPRKSWGPELGSASISILHDDYLAILDARMQRVPGFDASDTVFDYVYAERSSADQIYVDTLVKEGLV